jgi:hypothetical protein
MYKWHGDVSYQSSQSSQAHQAHTPTTATTSQSCTHNTQTHVRKGSWRLAIGRVGALALRCVAHYPTACQTCWHHRKTVSSQTAVLSLSWQDLSLQFNLWRKWGQFAYLRVGLCMRTVALAEGAQSEHAHIIDSDDRQHLCCIHHVPSSLNQMLSFTKTGSGQASVLALILKKETAVVCDENILKSVSNVPPLTAHNMPRPAPGCSRAASFQ